MSLVLKRVQAACLFILLLPASAAFAAAQSTPPPDSSQPTAQAQFKSEPAYSLPPDKLAKAKALNRIRLTTDLAGTLWGLAVLWWLLASRAAARLSNWTQRKTGRRWLQGLLFFAAFIVITTIAGLPLDIIGHAASRHYGISVQGWGGWFGDQGKALAVSLLIAAPILLFFNWIVRASPRRYWLWAWLMAQPLILLAVFVSPLVFDPLFNKFEPLSKDHADLVASIESLTKHAGVPIPPERMFLMMASRKTNAINAYVTGLGASKRVVIWDTTIQKMSNEEALFVVGHELGHYVLGHVWRGFLLGAAGLLLALYLLFRGLHWALDRWGRDWKIYGQEDWASLAVLLLLLQALLFVASPVISGISRMQEHAADVYGLEVIHGLIPNSEEVAAHAFQVLGELDLSDPNPPPFITFWLYSHPPLAERLVFAHSYDPWSKRESPKYVK